MGYNKYRLRHWFFTLTLSTSWIAQAQSTPELSMDSFLQQVQGGNDQYQSVKSLESAYELRSDEWKLGARPNLFGSAESTKDQRLTGAPVFQGRETQIKSYSLGLEQTTHFGLDAKLYYQYVDTAIIGVEPTLFPVPQFVIASPVLELNQSLWRNFLGAEINARQENAAARVQAAKYSASFDILNLKSNAESAYWKLATARKLVAAAQENLTRASRIESWSARRSQMSLADKSDLLQAKATVAARKIELQTAIDAEKSASLDFNKMRGTEDNVVPEKLQTLTTEQITQIPLPERADMRADVKAAKETARYEQASAQLSAESSKPDVKVYAKLSLNGRDGEAERAINQAWTSDYPMTTVGVKLNVPLSLGIASDTRAGYRAEARSAELRYKRKNFESEKDWQNLVQQFEDAKRRLTLALEMEIAQKNKVDYEKIRHSKGRTTTYQVILFEQDYATAQVARINLEADILNLLAQLKTFGGSK